MADETRDPEATDRPAGTTEEYLSAEPGDHVDGGISATAPCATREDVDNAARRIEDLIGTSGMPLVGDDDTPPTVHEHLDIVRDKLSDLDGNIDDSLGTTYNADGTVTMTVHGAIEAAADRIAQLVGESHNRVAPDRAPTVHERLDQIHGTLHDVRDSTRGLQGGDETATLTDLRRFVAAQADDTRTSVRNARDDIRGDDNIDNSDLDDHLDRIQGTDEAANLTAMTALLRTIEDRTRNLTPVVTAVPTAFAVWRHDHWQAFTAYLVATAFLFGAIGGGIGYLIGNANHPGDNGSAVAAQYWHDRYNAEHTARVNSDNALNLVGTETFAWNADQESLYCATRSTNLRLAVPLFSERRDLVYGRGHVYALLQKLGLRPEQDQLNCTQTH